MYKCGILFLVVMILVALGIFSTTQAEGIDVTINPYMGQVYFVADGDTAFVGYELTGPVATTWFRTSDLRWNSLQDQGLGGMGELTTVDPNRRLSEGTFSSLSVTDGAILYIGTPYDGPSTVGASDFAFIWGNASFEDISGKVNIIPEPGTLVLLAAAGGLFLLGYACRRRRRTV